MSCIVFLYPCLPSILRGTFPTARLEHGGQDAVSARGGVHENVPGGGGDEYTLGSLASIEK